MSLESALAANTEALLAQNALLAKLLERGVDAPTPSAVMPDASTEKPAPAKKSKNEEPTKSAGTSNTSQPSSIESQEKPAPSENVKNENAAADASSIDYETVKNAVLEVSKKSRETPAASREQAEALLQRFGVQKISQLDAAVYGEVHALAQKILTGEYDATAAELPEGAEGLE